MSIEQSQSSAASDQERENGCCHQEWESGGQSAWPSPVQHGSEQGLPQYYLPCAD